MIVIITTIHKKEDAVAIGKGLLKNRLIVCYNLFPVESAYWWKGKILKENEMVVLMKTRAENFEKVEAYIKKHSGYEVPEIISVKPEKVNASYLAWLQSEI